MLWPTELLNLFYADCSRGSAIYLFCHHISRPPVAGDRPLVTGSSIAGGGRALGQLLSTADQRGLALVRLDRLAEALAAGEPIRAGEATVTVEKPGWAQFAVPGAAAA